VPNDDSQEKQDSKNQNENGLDAKENGASSESQDKKETTEQPSSRNPTPPQTVAAATAIEQGLASATSDTEAIQTSVQTTSENDSAPTATDEKKSEKEAILPGASGSAVDKADSKRPATEPTKKVSLESSLTYKIYICNLSIAVGIGYKIYFHLILESYLVVLL